MRFQRLAASIGTHPPLMAQHNCISASYFKLVDPYIKLTVL